MASPESYQQNKIATIEQQLTVLRSEVTELRTELGTFRDETRERFAGVESTLRQILDRLPPD